VRADKGVKATQSLEKAIRVAFIPARNLGGLA
jgi:hypothetical protein